MRVALLRFSCATLAALLLFLTSNASYGVQSDWKASLGDWFISTNWTSAGVPNSTIDAVIANGGTALITAPGAEALDLFLGAPTGVGSTGTLLVTNNGSSLGSLTIDNLALIAQSPAAGVTVTGTLTISNGASLFQPAGAAMTVASGTNPSHGNITITGAGSSLNIAALALGFDIGQATLNVQSGGAALSTETSIAGSGNHGASSSGSTGSATVTGAGSAWYVSNHTYPFNIGYDGNGSLTISSGGTLGSYSAAIANQPGSVGSVTVTGAGSTWTNVENIYVSGNGTSSASGGNGALHITSGGLVNAHLLEVFSTGLANVDNGSTSTAGLVVAGDPVAYTLGGSYGDLTVGSNTAGRMEIQSGGAVASLRGYMGFGSGSDGSVLVTGSGAQRSSWQCQGSVWVGNGGNGTLEVRNGGRVTSAGNGYIAFSNNTTGYAIVSGASSGWITQQSLFIGGNAGAPGGSGTLQIEDQAFVQAFNVTLYNSGTLVLGTSPALLGNFTALGGFIQPIADTTFFQDITLGAGGVRVLTHGFDLTLAGTLSGSGVLEKSKGRFTEGPGTLTLSHANTYSGGTSLLAGKLLVTNTSGSATGSGLVTASSGTVLGGTGTIGSPVTILSGATLLGGNGVAASLALKLSNNLTINSG